MRLSSAAPLVIVLLRGFAADIGFAQSRGQPEDRSYSVGLIRDWTQIPARGESVVELLRPASGARISVTALGLASPDETRQRFDREVDSVALASGREAALQNFAVGFGDGAGGTALAYVRWNQEDRTSLVSCRDQAYRLEGKRANADDFKKTVMSLRCLPSENLQAAGPGSGPAFDPAKAPPEASEMVRTTDFNGTGVVATELRARERISTIAGALIAATLVLGVLWLSGILLVYLMRKSLGRAARLAEAHRTRCGVYGAAAFIVPTVALISFHMGGVVLGGVVAIFITAGSAAGCVFTAAKVFKIDAAEFPIKAYNIGFALQTALMLVPFFGQMVFFSLVTWGIGGLILLETGAALPEDDVPLPPAP